MVPDDISSCPFTYPLSDIDPQSILRHPQASHGEQFWKLDLQISRNGSQLASLPKSRQHRQMVPMDYCLPLSGRGFPTQGGRQSTRGGWLWRIVQTFYAATGSCGFHPMGILGLPVTGDLPYSKPGPLHTYMKMSLHMRLCTSFPSVWWCHLTFVPKDGSWPFL